MCSVSTSPIMTPRHAPLHTVLLVHLIHLQSDLSVEQAVALWPKVTAKARACGSPAMASNYSWLGAFLKSAQVEKLLVAVSS